LPMPGRYPLVPSLVLAWLLTAAVQAPAADPTPVDYNRDIRPLLAGKCFTCHGPDDKARKGKLRLDLRETAGKTVIGPGDPEKSHLLARVTSDVESRRMPPLKAGKPLSAEEIRLLRRWIEQGAKYAPHWAFVKPQRPPVPEVRAGSRPINPIDN